MGRDRRPIPIFLITVGAWQVAARSQASAIGILVPQAPSKTSPPAQSVAPLAAGVSKHPLLESELGSAQRKALGVGPGHPTEPIDAGKQQHEIDQLRIQMRLMQADEAKLRADNGLLRQELGEWRAVGERMAASAGHRGDTHAMAGARASGGNQPRPPARAALAVASPNAFAQYATARTNDRLPMVEAWQVIAIAVGFMSLAAAFKVGMAKDQSNKPAAAAGGDSAPPTPSSASAWYDWSPTAYKAFLRLAGIGDVFAEITEVHVGGLSGTRSLYVRIRDGHGQPQSTEIVHSSGYDFVKFREPLALHLRSSDRACKVSLVDAASDEDLAEVEIATRQLFQLVNRRHQRHYRSLMRFTKRGSRLFTSELRLPRPPYIAMKLRETTSSTHREDADMEARR